MWGRGKGDLDCRRYVQPPDLEWDWIAAGMYSPQSQSCFGFGVDGIAAGTGGEEGGRWIGVSMERGQQHLKGVKTFPGFLSHQNKIL